MPDPVEGEDPKGDGDKGKTPVIPTPNGGGDPTASADTFTQAQRDALAEKERKRGISKGQADLLSDLGVESADDLKTQLSELEKLRTSQLSDTEKKDAEIAKLSKEIEDGKIANQTAKDTANQRLMRAAVITEAAKAEHDIQEQARPDVWAFVDREALTVTDAGEVEGVEGAVKAVVEARPYLVSNGQKPKPAGTPRREPGKKTGEPPKPITERKRPLVRL